MKRGDVTLDNCQKIWDVFFSDLNMQTKLQVQGQTMLCEYEDASRFDYLKMKTFFNGQKIWTVTKGTLHVVLHDDAGKSLVLFKITSGNAGFVLPVGMSPGYLESVLGNSEIVSVGHTELCYLSEQQTKQVYNECGKVRNWQSQQSMKVFSDLVEAVCDLGFLTLYERLQKRLYEYCTYHNTNIVRMTHEQLAEELATSREVISRLLKKMESECIIKIERKSIRVLERRASGNAGVRMVS